MVNKLLPGPITLIIEVDEATQREKVEAILRDRVGSESDASTANIETIADAEVIRKRLYHQNTIGLRCPDDLLAHAILRSTPAPILASSANRRGQRPPLEIDAAIDAVGDTASLIVDGGRCRYAKPSTIIKMSAGEHGPVYTIEREGVYDERTIRRALRWNLLLVCTGNTCRSPMAAGIARSLLAGQRGIATDELETAGIGVESAGAFAGPGIPATPEAVDVMHSMDIDLTTHRSQPLTPQLIRDADVIYTMTGSHYDAVLAYDPSAASKLATLDPDGDIDDPIGGDLDVYKQCAKQIRQRLETRLKEQQP